MLELEHYTNQQMGKGGRGVALETEQRLEAVRQFARAGIEDDTRWREFLSALLDSSRKECLNTLIYDRTAFDRYIEQSYESQLRILRDNEATKHIDFTCLDWVEGEHFYSLRSDMRDIIWSVLEEHKVLGSENP